MWKILRKVFGNNFSEERKSLFNQPQIKILDIGASEGRFLFGLAYKYNNVRCVGIDIENTYPNFYTVEGLFDEFRFRKLRTATFSRRCPPYAYNILNYRLFPIDDKYLPRDRDQKQVFIENIQKLLTMAEQNSRIFEFLLIKVSDLRVYRKSIDKIIFKLNPEIRKCTLRQLIESDIPANFRQYFQQFTNELKFVKSDGLKIPFPNKSFDMVFLQGLGNVEKNVIPEAVRVSKEHRRRTYNEILEAYQFWHNYYN